MAIQQLDTVLLVGAAVLLAAIVAVRVSVGVGLPSLLLYLGIGIVLGEAVLGIEFSDADLAHSLGFAALILILAEGGLTTKWSEVRPTLRLGLLLSTVGVAVSVGVMAVGCHYLLGFEWQLALLLGAITTPTDAAAVFSVLRRVPLRPSVRGTLEAESGLNDAPIAILVTAVSTGSAGEHHWLVLLGLIAVELVGGCVLGVIVGWLGARVLAGSALPSSGLYPLAALAFTVLAYGGAAALHASGFAAVYVAALVLGNAELPHRAATRSFAEGVGWLAQIGLFVMLGLLVSPSRLEWSHLANGLLAGALLTLVARPLSVTACASWFRVPTREQVFLGWAGLRGAVPIVLATIPLAEEVPDATDLFDVVFVLVVVYTLLQGPTLPLLARRLGIGTPDEAREVEVEAAPLDRIAADLLQVRVPQRSALHGVEIGELRLPAGVSVSLVVRAGESFVPHRTTMIRRGDDLLVVAPRRVRELTESRLRAVSRRGRLAGWHGERGR
ncbi:MAG: potassium/proton antiporter [Nocardioidaceae bacterium]|nr:potassium/proton antiporter [Nocardioidaceae bacterium]